MFFCILQSARMNWCKKWSVGVTSSPHHLGWPDEGFHWGFPPDCVILFPKWPHSVQQHTSICTPQDAGTCTNTCTCIVAILYFVLAHYLHYFTKDTFLSFGFRGKSACFFSNNRPFLTKYANNHKYAQRRQIQIFQERDMCTRNDLILKSDSRRRVSGVFTDKAAISAAKASSCLRMSMRMKN